MTLTLKLLKEISRKEIFFCAAHLPGAGRIFAGASDGNIYDVDLLAEKSEPIALPGHSSFVTGIAVTGDLLVSGSYDCALIWRKIDGEIDHKAENAHSRWIRKV